jgi:peptide/nickel transport system permease protein
MWKYALRRILEMIPVLLGISFLVFLLVYLIPGDPVLYFLLEVNDPDPGAYERISAMLGMDKPVLDQYWDFISGAVTGDFGRSFTTDQPVADQLLTRLPITIRLALFAVLITTAISIPIGVYAATHHNRIGDYGTMMVALMGVSMPAFWFGLMLILLFAVILDVLPAGGMNFVGGVKAWDLDHMILPGLTLGIVMSAATARLTRSSLLEVMGSDYIRTARAKGAGGRRVVWKHGLRNALIPVVTMIGLQFAHEIGGAMIIEVVFAYPGIGLLTYEAILAQDYFMIQGCILLIATFFVVANLIVDLLYAYIDPRISYD